MKDCLLVLLLIVFFNAKADKNEDELLKLYHAEQYQKVVDEIDAVLLTDHQSSLSRLYLIKADALYFLNDLDESLKYYLLTIDHLVSYPLDTVYLIECYGHAGFVYSYLGQYTEAIPYYKEALAISQAANDSVEISSQFFQLGAIHASLGLYESAAKYYHDCYQIDFALKDTTAIGYDLSSMADMKCNLHEYKEAIGYYKKSFELENSRIKNHNSLILRTGRLGNAYFQYGKLDSANKYNALAIKGAIAINDSLSLMRQYIVKTNILLAENKLSEARALGRVCLDYFSAGEENSYQVASAFAVIDSYIASLQFNSAIQLTELVLALCRRNGFRQELVKAYHKQAEIYELQGNLHAALVSQKKYDAAKDSLFQFNKKIALSLLEQDFQLTNHRHQLEILKAKDELTQHELEARARKVNWLIALFILTLAGSVYIYIANRQRHKLANKLLQSEVNDLRNQIKHLANDETDVVVAMEKLLERAHVSFSKRELEILELALGDLTNSEIGEKAFVSVSTVKFHLGNIYTKLGLSNRQQIKQFVVQTQD